MIPYLLSVVSRPQALNVHFLGLFFEGFLVLDDSHDDLAVEEDAWRDGDAVVEDVGVEDKANAVHVLAQVVVAAWDQLALCGPANKEIIER